MQVMKEAVHKSEYRRDENQEDNVDVVFKQI